MSDIPDRIKLARKLGAKPCPFCGSADVYVSGMESDGTIRPDEGAPNVECDKCEAGGSIAYDGTVADAIEIWNRPAR